MYFFLERAFFPTILIAVSYHVATVGRMVVTVEELRNLGLLGGTILVVALIVWWFRRRAARRTVLTLR